MQDFIYTICNAFCALPAWWQIGLALVCVLITSGIIYMLIWGLLALVYRALERMGVELTDADYEPYEDWMDYEAWRRG